MTLMLTMLNRDGAPSHAKRAAEGKNLLKKETKNPAELASRLEAEIQLVYVLVGSTLKFTSCGGT